MLWLALPLLSMAASLAPLHHAEAMSGYKWKFRPVVVFAPPGHPGLGRQRQIVTALRPAFLDRNIVVVYVSGNSVSVDLGPPPGLSADALRRRFGVAPSEFKALLVGKDGGVKLTSARPFPAQTLFRTIDAMPMRIDEIGRERRR